MQETRSLHSRLSSVGKGIKEEEIQGLQFWWCEEEEEIFKVFIIKILKVKAWAFIGKEMDSKAESEEHEEEEASEESESGVASLALAIAFVSKSIFNTEENNLTNKADEGDDD